jgi:hypothetical protein
MLNRVAVPLSTVMTCQDDPWLTCVWVSDQATRGAETPAAYVGNDNNKERLADAKEKLANAT